MYSSDLESQRAAWSERELGISQAPREDGEVCRNPGDGATSLAHSRHSLPFNPSSPGGRIYDTGASTCSKLDTPEAITYTRLWRVPL